MSFTGGRYICIKVLGLQNFIRVWRDLQPICGAAAPPGGHIHRLRGMFLVGKGGVEGGISLPLLRKHYKHYNYAGLELHPLVTDPI